MVPYNPPLTDIRYLITRLIGADALASLPGYEAVADELVDAVLDETAKIAGDVFAPLNQTGDRIGAKFENGKVTMPPGFSDAYHAFVDGGWNGLAVDTEAGGQGLPVILGMAVQEMLQSANLALALCALLNQGAIELLSTHGDEKLRAKYLPRLVSGEWTGTMNLTEPQAGSDVGAVKTRAVRVGAQNENPRVGAQNENPRDGNIYKITGQKIFISYGDHDMADNILHLVLARLPDAPEGTKGLSLFLVPKILVDDNGELGAENDVRTVSIEHKLGQHASPTCVLAFGDKTGATGYLVGAENGGIAAMFTMMNNARIGVGVQGLALMERAYQQARDYAQTRIQSRDIARPKDPPVAIIEHPDVRRMLMLMRSQTEAARAMAYSCAYAVDLSRRSPDKARQQAAAARVDLLTPIVKGWITDLSNEVTSLGVQVCGGMGYIEETGAAQHMRDARVLAIYEGTNGIQANDLIFRKLLRNTDAMNAMLGETEALLSELSALPDETARALKTNLASGLTALRKATGWILENAPASPALAAAVAFPYLKLAGTALGGHFLFKAALYAHEDLQNGGDKSFLAAKLVTAHFYANHVLTITPGLAETIVMGGMSVQKGGESGYF